MGRDPLGHSGGSEARAGRGGDAGSGESAWQKRLAEVFEHFATAVAPSRSQRAGGHGKETRLMSRKQLLEATHFLGFNPSKAQLREFTGLSGSGAGSARVDASKPHFTRSDFEAFVASQRRLTASDLMSAFRIIDENGDGQLSREELELMLTNFGERMSKSEVQEVLRLFDADASGSIDFTEFCDMLVAMSETAEMGAALPLASDSGGPLIDVEDEPDEDVRGGGAAELPEWYSEPDDLVEWCGDRLHGSFQAGRSQGRVVSQLYTFVLREPDEVFLSLRMTRERTQTATVDARFYVVRMTEGLDGQRYPNLVGASQLLSHTDPALRLTLDAGVYFVVPFSTGCNLRRRRPEAVGGPLPPLMTPGPDGEEVLSKPFKDALAYTFSRFDFDGTGTLSRSEFSIRSLYVDGEVCSDEMWGAVQDHFDTVEGELTFDGYCQLNELALKGERADGRTDEDFYDRNLAPLGFNLSLEPDHVAKFVLFCFTRKPRSGLAALPADERMCEQVDLLDVIETGELRTVYGLPDGLELYVRQDSRHASFAVKNTAHSPRRCVLSFQGSVNAVINRESLEVSVPSVAPGGAVGVCHLVPAPNTAQWRPVCDAKA